MRTINSSFNTTFEESLATSPRSIKRGATNTKRDQPLAQSVGSPSNAELTKKRASMKMVSESVSLPHIDQTSTLFLLTQVATEASA